MIFFLMKDYLKYWRVIRYYTKAKYGISTPELEMLLFLRSETYFSKDKFGEFDELISWDKNRFEKLRQAGWIQVFRKRQGKRKALYQLSYKTKRMLTSIYKKLEGEEISELEAANPLFAKNVSYNDKVYRNFIKSINAFTRQQRYRSDL